MYGLNPPNDLEGGYTCAVDMWSLGIMTYAMLAGDLPFIDREDSQCCENRGQYLLHTAAKTELRDFAAVHGWGNAKKRSQDFVLNLVLRDPRARMSADEAIQHSWFTNEHHEKEFEDLYQRSISDWKPTKMGSDAIDRIPSSYSKRGRRSTAGSCQRTLGTSEHFQETAKTLEIHQATLDPQRPSVESQLLNQDQDASLHHRSSILRSTSPNGQPCESQFCTNNQFVDIDSLLPGTGLAREGVRANRSYGSPTNYGRPFSEVSTCNSVMIPGTSSHDAVQDHEADENDTPSPPSDMDSEYPLSCIPESSLPQPNEASIGSASTASPPHPPSMLHKRPRSDDEGEQDSHRRTTGPRRLGSKALYDRAVAQMGGKVCSARELWERVEGLRGSDGMMP